MQNNVSRCTRTHDMGILATATVALFVCALGRGDPLPDVESFEHGIPPYVTTSRPESLGISPWRYLHGTNSLRWDWEQGEAVVIRRDIGNPARTGGFLNRAAFAVSVYMETPVDGALQFAFCEGETVTGSFRFPLQFKGWRQARIFYDSFPTGRPTAGVDTIRIAAPDNVPQGTAFFDLIRYNTLVYYSASINPENLVRRNRIAPDEQRFPRPAGVTEEERAAIRRLMGERPGADAGGPGIRDAQVDELLEKVKAAGVVRDAHGLRGPGLLRSSFYYAAPREYGAADIKTWPDEHGPNGIEVGLPGPDPVIRLADAVAAAFRTSNDSRQRERLLEAFSLLADYLSDQGLSIGLDTVIRMRAVPELADGLEAHLERVEISLLAERFFVGDETPVEANMDFYASTGPYRLRNMLRLCLAQRDDAERVRWLNAWKALFERSLLQPNGPFKPDGSAYHHRGHYPSYAQNAIGNLPTLLTQIKGTPWMPSAEALEPFRRAMLALRLYCNKLSTPIALTGRSPFAGGIYEGILRHFADVAFDAVARLGTPDGKHSIDPVMAAAYLRLVPEAIDKEPYRSLGIQPEPDPQGTFSMPYAALLCQRRDNWLASVKGQSRYVWGSERQARRNCYGFFQGLGNLEILAGGEPVNATDSGRQAQGWDWRRFEGVTAPQIPLTEIDRSWQRVSGTTYSPETFVGGLAHRGNQGVFAMILNQNIMSAQYPLTGRKSWFFDENRIVCLGSDLSCGIAEYPTQTTLCQKSLPVEGESASAPTFRDPKEITAVLAALGLDPSIPHPTLVDGMQVRDFPETRELDPGSPHWFMDVQQTGYYLPAGQAVTVARQRQKSRDVNDVLETEGVFLTAWIDHGPAPVEAQVEYMLVVRATPDDMQRFTAAPPYRVMQRNRSAHVVWFPEGRRWACAFFEPQETNPHVIDDAALPVKAVDRPCLVVAEMGSDQRLHLSVADPDLNLENGVSMVRPLRLSLRGHWRLLHTTAVLCAWPLPNAADQVRVVRSDAEETVLEIAAQHGASYTLSLTDHLRE